MSLIHEVLNNLDEENNKKHLPNQFIIGDLPVIDTEKSFRFSTLLNFFLMLIAVAWGSVLIYHKFFYEHKNVKESISHSPGPSVVNNQAQHAAATPKADIQPLPPQITPVVSQKSTTIASGGNQSPQNLSAESDTSQFSLTPIRQNVAIKTQAPQFNEAAIQGLLEKKQLKQAEESLKNTLTQAPNSVQARILLAQTYLMKNKLTLAIDTLNKVQPDIQQHPEFFVLLAGLQLKANQFTSAFDLYHTLSKIEPANPKIWLGMSLALQGLGKSDLSDAAHDQYIKVSEQYFHPDQSADDDESS